MKRYFTVDKFDQADKSNKTFTPEEDKEL